MRASILQEPGGPLGLEDVPLPPPGPTKVLGLMRACSLGFTLVRRQL
jgi:hypothetical protein